MEGLYEPGPSPTLNLLFVSLLYHVALCDCPNLFISRVSYSDGVRHFCVYDVICQFKWCSPVRHKWYPCTISRVIIIIVPWPSPNLAPASVVATASDLADAPIVGRLMADAVVCNYPNSWLPFAAAYCLGFCGRVLSGLAIESRFSFTSRFCLPDDSTLFMVSTCHIAYAYVWISSLCTISHIIFISVFVSLISYQSNAFIETVRISIVI
jgi:hypothetical protein